MLWARNFCALSVLAHAPRDRTYVHASRIILLRHGESLGNLSDLAYVTTPDWKIPLSQAGAAQAAAAGARLRELIQNESVYVYVSPYLRARQTLEHIRQHLGQAQVVAVREEPRISEQQFGNFQDEVAVRSYKADRRRFGRFYYRFPNGEAGIDVYGRVTGFLGSMYREHARPRADNVLIVSHGLTMRLFLMRWFRWTVDMFEKTDNPPNCGMVVMERDGANKFRLVQDAGIVGGRFKIH